MVERQDDRFHNRPAIQLLYNQPYSTILVEIEYTLVHQLQ